MGHHRRWRELLTLLGGIGLILTFVITAVDGRYSPITAIGYLMDARIVRSPEEAITRVFSVLLLTLPYLFGLHVVLGSIRTTRNPDRNSRAPRWILGGILHVWLVCHASLAFIVLERHPDEVASALFYLLNLGLLLFGLWMLPRFRPSRSPAESLRRGRALGGLLSLLWFASWLLFGSQAVWPALILSIAAPTMILVASLGHCRKAESTDSGDPSVATRPSR